MNDIMKTSTWKKGVLRMSSNEPFLRVKNLREDKKWIRNPNRTRQI